MEAWYLNKNLSHTLPENMFSFIFFKEVHWLGKAQDSLF